MLETSTFGSSLSGSNGNSRTYYDEGLLPARPESVDKNPEKLIKQAQARPRLFPFEHDQLLPKGEVFRALGFGANENSEAVSSERDQWRVTWQRAIANGLWITRAMLLIPKADRVLARDTITFPHSPIARDAELRCSRF